MKTDLNSSVPVDAQGNLLPTIDLASARPVSILETHQERVEEGYYEAKKAEEATRIMPAPFRNFVDRIAYYVGLGVQANVAGEVEAAKTIQEFGAERPKQATGTMLKEMLQVSKEFYGLPADPSHEGLIKSFVSGYAPELNPDFPADKITTIGKMFKEYSEGLGREYGEEIYPHLVSPKEKPLNIGLGMAILSDTYGRTILDLAGLFGDFYSSPLDYLILRGITKGALVVADDIPIFKRDLLKDLQAGFRGPETITIKSEGAENFQNVVKGVLTEGEIKDFMKTIGGENIQKAFLNGAPIELPSSAMVTLTDKPYWSAIKRFFGKEPTFLGIRIFTELPRTATLRLGSESGQMMVPPEFGDLVRYGNKGIGKFLRMQSAQEAVLSIAGEEVVAKLSDLEFLRKPLPDDDKTTYTPENAPIEPTETPGGTILPPEGKATTSPVESHLTLALKLKDGSVVSDATAKLHSDIVTNQGIDPDEVADVGYLDAKGEYQATKTPDEKGGAPLETLPEVPKEALEKAKGLVKEKITPEEIKPSVLKTKEVKPLVRKITGQTKIGELVSESEALSRMLGQEEKFTGKIISQAKKEEAKLLAGAMRQFFSYMKDIDKLEEQLKVEKFNTEADKVLAQQKLKVLKLVKALTKDIPENIAVEYREMIEKIKDKFDFSRRSEKTIAAKEGMREYVERMKVQGKPVDIPASELEMFDKTSLQDMTIDQLEEVKNEVDRLAQLGRTKQTAREAVYKAKKEKIKTILIKEATPINSKQLPNLPIGDKVNAWIERCIILQNYAQKTGIGLTPIDGLADVTGMIGMKKILDADFSKYLTYNDEAITQWYDLTKDFTEKNFERIGAIAASRQQGGLERLANSGITKKHIDAIKLTSQEEKALKFVIDAFDKEYPAIKQYSKEVYNADVGEQENYVSFMSDYDLMSDLEIYERFGQTPEQIASHKTKTVEQGFTKERAKVSNIKLELNIDKIFRRHMDDVAYMLNTGKNIKMYFEIINSPEMREKLGDVGTLAWLQWLDLMARKGGTEGAKRIAALDILRQNIGAGVLAFRLSSALVQFSSFADTIATIGVEWATKGAVEISTSSEWRNFIMDNFPEIKKAVGDDIAFREFGEGFMGNLTRTGLKPLQILDGVMRVTAACGSYQKLCAEKGIIIDLKNPNIELIVEATRLMRQSQGSSFFKDQPLAITTGYGLTDNKSLNKAILTFQSFMLNRWDNINRQVWRMGIKEKDYSKAISSFFWLVIFAGAVEEGIRRVSRKITLSRTKERNFAMNAVLNMIQNVPLAGQLTSSITYSSNPVPVIKTLEDLIAGLGSAIKGERKKTKIKGAIRAMGAAGSLVGIPGSSQAAQIAGDIIPQSTGIINSLIDSLSDEIESLNSQE